MMMAGSGSLELEWLYCLVALAPTALQKWRSISLSSTAEKQNTKDPLTLGGFTSEQAYDEKDPNLNP